MNPPAMGQAWKCVLKEARIIEERDLFGVFADPYHIEVRIGRAATVPNGFSDQLCADTTQCLNGGDVQVKTIENPFSRIRHVDRPIENEAAMDTGHAGVCVRRKSPLSTDKDLAYSQHQQIGRTSASRSTTHDHRIDAPMVNKRRSP